MKIREFMNTYSRYGKVDIPNICEQCINLNREYISNERKEENKMELRDFMNKYIYNTKGYKEELQKIERFIKLNERKEENKMEKCIKIIIRKDEQYNSSEGRIKYVLTLVNQQDKVIFTDYFKLDHNSVLVYLSEHTSRILNVYSFNDYIALLKSYGIIHKIEKMLSEEEIREEYSRIINTGSLYKQGYIEALEYVLGIDNE